MANVAHFNADFTQWNASLQNAKDELKAFEATGKGAQSALQRLFNDVSGANIIKQAQTAQAALEEMQKRGIAPTEAAQQRLNKMIEEGLKVYQALGKDAPAAMAKVHGELQKLAAANEAAAKGLTATADATKGVSAGTESMTQKVVAFASGLAVFELGKQLVTGLFSSFKDGLASTLALGDSLSNLSTKTGMSVEGLQRLKFAGAGAGVSIESLADASAMLGVRLESGDKGAIGALRRLGLSLETFKAMRPDEQMLALNESLMKVSSTSERNAIQADLFGKAWKAVAPAMAQDLTELGQKAEDLGIVLDAQTVAAIDNMGDSLDAAKLAGEGMMARFMLPFLDALNNVGSTMSGFSINIGDLAESLGRVAVSGKNLYDPLNLALALLDTGKAKVDRAAKSFDELGEAMKRSMRSAETADPYIEGLIPGVTDFEQEIRRLEDAQKKAAEAAKKHAAELARVSGLDKVQAARALTDLIAELGGTSKIAASQFAQINKALTDGIVVGTELGMKLPSAMVQFARETQTANTQLVTMAEILKTLPSYVERIPVPMPALPGAANGLPSGLGTPVSTPGVNGAPVPTAARGASWFNQAQLPNILVGAFQGGGNAGKSLGGGIASAFFGSKAMTSALSKGVFGAAGGLLGSAVPVVGTLLGGLAGDFLGGLFGPSKNALATQQANANIATTQQKLVDQFGGVDAIASQNRAGQELAAAWGSKGTAGEAHFNALAAEFTRMTQEQNQLLSDQEATISQIADIEERRNAAVEALKPTWAAVSELASKYQINVEGLGKAVTQLGTTASFKSLLEDIQTFERAGADVGGMLFGMKEEISKVVSESRRLGTEIPANMRPYVEELAKSGLLLDENGEKITDLSTLKWGAPVETEADKAKASIAKMDDTLAKLRDTLDKVVEALSRMLPNAAAEGARGVQDAFDRNRPTFRYDIEANGDGNGTRVAGDTPGFASGSGGIRNFGTGTLAMLHGREGVFTEAQIAALQRRSSGAGGGLGATVNVYVDASNSFYDSETSRQRHAELIGTSVSRGLRQRVLLARAA